LFVIRGGPEGAWRRRHTAIRGWTGRGVAADEGYFLGYFFGLEGRTLM